MIVAESLINDKSALKALKTKLKYNYMVKKRRVLAVGVVLNFLILAVVKYTNFVIANLNTLFSWMNINTKFGFLQIIFPLGISFYTFQSVGYLIDVYRGKIKADHHFFHYTLFVSYFPQIIQGPISRYDQLANQLMESHLFDYQRIKFGIQRMLWGFFKKMVIADRIAVVVNQVFDHFYEKTMAGLLFLLLYCFMESKSMQIFRVEWILYTEFLRFLVFNYPRISEDHLWQEALRNSGSVGILRSALG